MTATELVALLEGRGAHLRVDGTELVVSPAATVTPADQELLTEMKTEVILLLGIRSLGVEWSTVGLYSLGRVLEVVVPWSDERLMVAPNCWIARKLRSLAGKRRPVWCVCELAHLLSARTKWDDESTLAAPRITCAVVLTELRKGLP